jgi:DNA replication protein DnaC
MDGQAGASQSRIRQCLQLLSREEGILRPQLVELLRNELHELCLAWQLDPEQDGEKVRHAVAYHLRALISSLEPRPARQELSPQQRKAQYQNAIAISFNILEEPDLFRAKLQERRAWLADKDRGVLKIAMSISQRDLQHAIGQMEQLLNGPEYNLPTLTARVLDGNTADMQAASQPNGEVAAVGRSAEQPAIGGQRPVEKPWVKPILNIGQKGCLWGTPIALEPAVHKGREQLAKSLEEQLRRVTASRQFDSRLEVSYVTAAETTFDHWPNIGSSEPLDLSGTTSRVAETFLKVPSGRLVVLGDAGSGKSMLVHQLSTSLMKLYRDAQIRLLPVSLTLSSFDSRSTPFERWLVDELATHLDGRKKQRRKNAEQLIREGALLLILDGFDETAEANATVVFDQISRWMKAKQASLVLASRSTEYSRVVSSSGYLTGAAAIEIQPLSIKSVEAYLPYTAQKVEHQGEIATSWHPVLERLKEPEGDAAATLLLDTITTPLDVSLARAAYSDPQSDPAELLEAGRFEDATDLRNYLFARYVDAMGMSFTSRTTGMPNSRKLQQFRRWLGWLAVRATIRDERDLSWWRSITYELDRAAAISCFSVALVVVSLLTVYGRLTDPILLLYVMLAVMSPGIGLYLPPRRLRFTRWKTTPEMRRVQVVDGCLLLVCFFAAYVVVVTTTTNFSDGYLRWPVPEVLAMCTLVPFAIAGLYLTPPSLATEGNPRDAFRQDCIAALWRAALFSAGLFGMLYSSWLVADMMVDFGYLAWICTGMFAITALASSAGGFMVASIYLKLVVRAGFHAAEFWIVAHRHDVMRKIGPQYQFRHRFLQERLAQSYLKDPEARIGRLTRTGSQAQLVFRTRYDSDPEKTIAQLEQLVEQAEKSFFFRSKLILGIWFMIIDIMHFSGQYRRALGKLDQLLRSRHYRKYKWRTPPVAQYYRVRVCLLLDIANIEAAKKELQQYLSTLSWRPSSQAQQESARAKKQLDSLTADD